VIRVLIADDHAILRAGLRALLDVERDMHVVGEASDGPDAMSAAAILRPDVVLLDVEMPRLCGLDAIGGILARCPQTRVLVLTMHAETVYARHALQLGASGYVLKDRIPDELMAAIRQVHAGRAYVDPQVVEALVSEESALGGGRGGAPSAPGLSEREQEVLALVALGHTSKEIAARLDVSGKTVETYRRRVREKLGCNNRAEIVRYAIAHGILFRPAGDADA